MSPASGTPLALPSQPTLRVRVDGPSGPPSDARTECPEDRGLSERGPRGRGELRGGPQDGAVGRGSIGTALRGTEATSAHRPRGPRGRDLVPHRRTERVDVGVLPPPGRGLSDRSESRTGCGARDARGVRGDPRARCVGSLRLPNDRETPAGPPPRESVAGASGMAPPSRATTPAPGGRAPTEKCGPSARGVPSVRRRSPEDPQGSHPLVGGSPRCPTALTTSGGAVGTAGADSPPQRTVERP